MENQNQNQIMRRTRSGKLLGSVSTTSTTTKKTVGSVSTTTTTKKTVRRETVEVVVTPYHPSINRSTTAGVELDVVSTPTNEDQQVEVTPWGSPVRNVIIDFGDEQSEEVQVTPPPPPVVEEEEEKRRKELQWNKEEQANEIETQQTRELIQDVDKQKQQERVGGEVQPEKNATSIEDDEGETQPASDAEVPPPPPPPPPPEEEEEEEEDNEEWFDVAEDEEPKEPSPPAAPTNAEETDRQVTTPPRFEVPQKRDDEETETMKKKRKAPSSAKKSEEKAAEDNGKNKRKKKKARRNRGDIAADYKTYIYRVLKQVHPDLGISSKGMATVNSFLNEMYEKIGDEAARLSRYTNAKTLSARDIQDAVKMVLPGDLGKHAIAEGAKAINRYATY